MQIKPEHVTIIMPHFGQTPEQEYAFEQSIASLKETAPDVPLIIAKNGNACPHDRHVRVVSQGQCKAVNAAVAIVNTPWIMITNDDMIFSHNWFSKLTDEIDFDGRLKRVGPGGIDRTLCISPILVEPRLGAPTFMHHFLGGAGGDFKKEEWMSYAAGYWHSEPIRTGFNLPFLIRKDLWDMIAGYDVNYDPWGSNSDSDLEYKIRLAGIQPLQNQNCLVYHFSQTSGTFEPQNRNYWEKNFKYFEEKWGFPRTDDGIWEATFTIPTPLEGRKFAPWWENAASVLL